MINPYNGMHGTIKTRQIYMKWQGNKIIEQLVQAGKNT